MNSKVTRMGAEDCKALRVGSALLRQEIDERNANRFEGCSSSSADLVRCVELLDTLAGRRPHAERLPGAVLGGARRIDMYFHCPLCIADLREGRAQGESPESYARLSVGFTRAGLQAWCIRHDCNVVHIDFEGYQHPAVLDRLPPKSKRQ